MTAAPKTGLQWDPEYAAIFNEDGEPDVSGISQVLAWSGELTRVYIGRQEIEEKVRERIGRAQTLKCEPHERVQDAYHVSGGKDPSGHTVDLRASWGEQCTCYDHMMNHRFCKHLIRVYLERGAFIADTWPNEYRPGLFSRAVQVDLKNAARKAEQDAQQAGGTDAR